MKVEKISDHEWRIVGADGQMIETGFRSNAEAWRRLDRLFNDPVSPAEKRADFGAAQILGS